MEIIGIFLYFVSVVPGVLQFFTFLILLGAFTWAKKFPEHCLTASLITTGFLLALVNVAAPYWVLVHLLFVVTGVVFWRRPKRTQVLAPVVALIIYGFCHYEMANVKTTFPSTAIWKIGERGQPESGNPPERLVELRFGSNRDQVEGRYSEQLADYLFAKNAPEIAVRIPISYAWGIAHGMGEIQVDGKDFPTESGGYGSWSAERPQAPFPKYYFGLRDLSHGE